MNCWIHSIIITTAAIHCGKKFLYNRNLLCSYVTVFSARISNTLIMYYSGLQARVEFRIFQNIFCEQFHLPTNSFSFDEYMELQFEKLIIDLIEITPLTWIVFGIAFLVLWLRFV